MIVTAQPSRKHATFCCLTAERADAIAMISSDRPIVGTARSGNSVRDHA